MKKIAAGTLAIIGIGIVLGLWLTGFAGKLNPVEWPWMSLSGYLFPVFLLLTLGYIAVAVFIKKRLLIIPVVGLIAAYNPVTLYCPFNHSDSDVPSDAIKFISYNTYNWGGGNEPANQQDGYVNSIVDYLACSNADIICLQESSPNGTTQKDIDSLIKPKYPYYGAIDGGGEISHICIFSKFPITAKERINYESTGNGTMAFTLDVKGKNVIVINNHLQTTGISMKDREDFGKMMHGEMDRDTMKTESKEIFGKIKAATLLRVPQADSVATFIKRHHGTPMIVCGDFNDIPQSYVYETIVQGLTDCYRSTGLGPGFSFRRYAMRVRIDNVFCTPDITPYNCKVDNNISSSDHFPIVCWLKL